jgi:hypothetical protein
MLGKHPGRLAVVLSTAIVFAAGQCSSVARQSGPSRECIPKFTGVPRDIDFIANLKWVQVTLTHDPQNELVAQTTNPRILSILETAFSHKWRVSVDFKDDQTQPKRLTCVVLDLKMPGGPQPQPGEVLSLAYDETDNTCRATIQAKATRVDVKTQDVKAQGILETAASMKYHIDIDTFEYDANTKEITRVKVNQDLP